MAELFDRKQAAKKLDISEDQVTGLVLDGELRYINVGRGKKRSRMRFTDEDLDDLIERRQRGNHVCLQAQKVTVLPVRFLVRPSSVSRLDGTHNSQRRRKIRNGRAGEGQGAGQGHEAFRCLAA